MCEDSPQILSISRSLYEGVSLAVLHSEKSAREPVAMRRLLCTSEGKDEPVPFTLAGYSNRGARASSTIFPHPCRASRESAVDERLTRGEKEEQPSHDECTPLTNAGWLFYVRTAERRASPKRSG